MLPIFPLFKKLELGDRPFIEVITKKHPPYSDFTFTSLYIWNTDGGTQVSILNNCLILKMKDYTSSKVVLTLLGDDFNSKMMNSLLLYVLKEKVTIKLIPEVILHKENMLNYFKEDPDQHDYIYSITDVISLEGSKYKKKRNMCKRFARAYEYQLCEIDLEKKQNQEDVLELFTRWQVSKGRLAIEVEGELAALRNLLSITHSLSLLALGVYINNKLEGVTISELLHNKYSVIHFQKYNSPYLGLTEYLFVETLKKLLDYGAENLNYEQDLGIVGLRKAKTLWRPAMYLKKYSVESTSLLD